MRKIILFTIASIVLFLSQSAVAHAQSDSVTVAFNSARRVVSRNIGSNLVLRIVKDGTTGWMVEVRKRRGGTRNLIHGGKTGSDPSQVYAWHVDTNEYPNERELKVRGYPYTITISLLNPKTIRTGKNVRFTSGRLRVGWRRT